MDWTKNFLRGLYAAIFIGLLLIAFFWGQSNGRVTIVDVESVRTELEQSRELIGELLETQRGLAERLDRIEKGVESSIERIERSEERITTAIGGSYEIGDDVTEGAILLDESRVLIRKLRNYVE